MVLKKIKLSVIVLILFIYGCTKKDPLTLPVRIHLQVGCNLVQCYYSDDPYFPTYTLTLKRCEIGIQRMHFEGIREAGDKYFFDTDPKLNLPVFGFIEQYEPVSEFDIPQGIYSPLSWEIYLKRITFSELADQAEPALQNAGLYIKGFYNHVSYLQNGLVDSVLSIPFIFVVPDAEPFIFRSLEVNIFNSGEEYTQKLLFDFTDAFESINPDRFEEAEITGEYPNDKIIISNEKNTLLFNDMLKELKSRLQIHIN